MNPEETLTRNTEYNMEATRSIYKTTKDLHKI